MLITIEAIGTLSRRTERLIDTYLTQLGTELLPDGSMFRNQAGTAYSKDALCRSFRKAQFPADTRKLPDFRRSGSQEAQASTAVSGSSACTK
jgi:histidine ammonia-lyase